MPVRNAESTSSPIDMRVYEYVHHTFQFNVYKYIMHVLSPAEGLGKEGYLGNPRKTMARNSKSGVSSGIAILAVEILVLFTV